jgi:hypothetical protein
MKKTLFFISIAFLFTSCAKDYNCKCTYVNVDDPADTYTSDSPLRNTKKNAEENCDFLEGTSYNGNTVFEGTCELLDE